jgi:hypothetical protein
MPLAYLLELALVGLLARVPLIDPWALTFHETREQTWRPSAARRVLKG